MKDWWHKRTDGVEGIAKLIGEPGSMFRQNLVIPLILIIVAAVIGIAIERKTR